MRMSTTMVMGMMMMMMMVVVMVRGDITKDKEECASVLTGLATCLTYVGGQAKAPTMDCCTGLKQVLKDNKKCLCVLIKDRDDPSLGLTINATLALGLPRACHAPSDDAASECPALLHLAPNSPDAKVFTDFGKATAAATTAPAAPSSDKSSGKSGGSSAKDTTSDGHGGIGKGGRGLLPLMFLRPSFALLSLQSFNLLNLIYSTASTPILLHRVMLSVYEL